MAIESVFKGGNSQTARLPRELQFSTNGGEIARRGDGIVPRQPVGTVKQAFDALASLPGDFLAEDRQDVPAQSREGL